MNLSCNVLNVYSCDVISAAWAFNEVRLSDYRFVMQQVAIIWHCAIHCFRFLVISTEFRHWFDDRACLFVCLSVCLSTSIFPKLQSNFYHFCARYLWPCSVLFWRRCDTLWTSGFVDDVIFAPLNTMARNKWRVKGLYSKWLARWQHMNCIAPYKQNEPIWSSTTECL